MGMWFLYVVSRTAHLMVFYSLRLYQKRELNKNNVRFNAIMSVGTGNFLYI